MYWTFSPDLLVLADYDAFNPQIHLKKILYNEENWILIEIASTYGGFYVTNKSFNVMFGNDNCIWKFKIDSNLLFGKLKIFQFGFASNFIIVFKGVKVENDYPNLVILKFFIYNFIIEKNL